MGLSIFCGMGQQHTVKLEERKSARVLFEFQEMQEGGDRL